MKLQTAFWIAVAFAGSGLVVAGDQSAAAENAQSFDVEWRIHLHEDGRIFSTDAMAVGSDGTSVVVLVKSCDSPTLTNGRYELLQISDQGVTSRRTGIERQNEEALTPPVPVPGTQICSRGRRLAIVGTVTGDAGPMLLQLNSEWELASSEALPPGARRSISQVHQSICLPEGFLLVGGGGATGGGAAARMDGNGSLLWQASFDHGRQYEQARSAASLGSEGFLVAGESAGEPRQFGIGECDIWLAKCDVNGVVGEESVRFPGRSPLTCTQRVGDFSIILYDTSFGGFASYALVAYDENLRRQWSAEADVAGLWAQLPAVFAMSSSSIAVAGCDGPELCVMRYGSDGTVLGQFRENAGGIAGGAVRLCTTESRMIIAVPSVSGVGAAATRGSTIISLAVPRVRP